MGCCMFIGRMINVIKMSFFFKLIHKYILWITQTNKNLIPLVRYNWHVNTAYIYSTWYSTDIYINEINTTIIMTNISITFKSFFMPFRNSHLHSPSPATKLLVCFLTLYISMHLLEFHTIRIILSSFLGPFTYNYLKIHSCFCIYSLLFF